MSGIVCVFNQDGAPVMPQILQDMTEVCAYRGPDGIQYWGKDNVGFAYLALHATPESVREQQPLVSEDKNTCLIADARIDNRSELIGTLAAKGYIRQKNPTDARLILAAYKCWQEACPQHLIGDFAFAIFDAQKQRLFCARDPFGIRPLHYAQVGKTFCIASEAQQILHHPAVPWQYNEVAMADHLISCCFDEASTIFKEVFQLPPAHQLVVTGSKVQLSRYWDINPEAQIRYRHDQDYVTHFGEIYRRAVSDRLRTQANTIAVKVSGGLDSGSVASMAQRLFTEDNSRPLPIGFSFAFDQIQECDERAYSRSLKTELGMDIKYINAERFWYLGDSEAFRPSLETPFLTMESITRQIMTSAKQRGAKVLLDGHGGDSCLQGSSMVYADRFLRGRVDILKDIAKHARERNIPYFRLLYHYLIRPSALHIGWHLMPEASFGRLTRALGWQPRVPWRRNPTSIPTWVAHDFAQRTSLQSRIENFPIVPMRFGWLSKQKLYQTILALGSVRRAVYWANRVGARFGLETRHPYLDRRLIEFLLAIPPDQIFRAGQSKFILRRAMKGILPDVIRNRPRKTSFHAFKDFSFRQKESEQIADLFKAPILGELGIIDSKKLRSEYADYCAGVTEPLAFTNRLYPTITLELWLRQYHKLFRA